MHLRSKGGTNLLSFQDIDRIEREATRVRREVQRAAHIERLGLQQEQAPMNAPFEQDGQANRAPVHQPRQPRVIGAGDAPNTHHNRHGIQPPPLAQTNFEVKPGFISMVQGDKFHGLPVEDPLDHLDNFERICGLVKINGVSEDNFKLRLFPFSLGEKARQWEKNLPHGAITTWADCKKVFLSKFFSPSRTARLRNEISSFCQRNNESFAEAWERFKGYTLQCPHHGFSEESLLSTLYRGVLPKIRMLLDTASNGYFLGKDVEAGLQLVENLAMSDGNYNEEYDRASRGSDIESTRKELKLVQEQLDKIMAANQRQVNFVGDCQANMDGQEMFQQEEANWVAGQYNNNNLSYRSTNVANPQDQFYPSPQPQGSYQKPYVPYNQGFAPKNTFTSSYQAPLQGNKPTPPPPHLVPSTQAPPPAPIPSMDATNALLQQLLQGQQAFDLTMTKKIAEINTKVDCFTNDLQSKLAVINGKIQQLENNKSVASTSLTQGKASASKDYCNVIHSNSTSQQEADIREIEQLLYGEDFVFPTPSKVSSCLNEDIEKQGGEVNFQKPTNEVVDKDMGQRGEKELMLEKPLLATQVGFEEVSRRKAEDKEDGVYSLPKLKNPGKFSISCTLGPLVIDDAMCDTGSSVSVISLDMVKKIGVTCIDYHPYKITFGDGKARQPKGIILDYPVKINNSIIPTDFIVMDIPSSKNLPLLLGTPFLNSVGALMDFTSMKVTLSKVNGKPSFLISHPISYYCGSMEDERDTLEEEERALKAEREAADLKRMEENLAYFHKQEEENFKKREPRKRKDKKSKKKSVELGEETRSKDNNDLDAVSLAAMFAEAEEETPRKEPPVVTDEKFWFKKEEVVREKHQAASSKHSLSLHPLGYRDGSIDYKVKSKGGSKPFSSARAIFPKEMLAKGEEKVKEMAFTIYTVEVQKGSSSNPSPSASFTIKPA